MAARTGRHTVEILMRATLLLVILGCAAAVTSGCASAPAVLAGPAPFPSAEPEAERVAPARTAALAADVLETALAQRGAPYRLGGSEPKSGFDCSGLVQYVFGLHHVDLPRTVALQYKSGQRIKRDAVERGDLVFFGPAGHPPTHVGIAVDANSFVHAPDSGAVVRVERLDAAYWKRRFSGAKRVL